MWIMTTFGAFMPALRPPKTVAADDNRTMQIRSRRQIDLNRLRERYLPDLGPIVKLPGADYPYRAYCTPRQWAEALAGMALDIDYQSFKDNAEDDPLHDMLRDVWSVIFRHFGGYKHGKPAWQQTAAKGWNPNAKSGGKHWWEDAAETGSIQWGAGYTSAPKITSETSMFRQPTLSSGHVEKQVTPSAHTTKATTPSPESPFSSAEINILLAALADYRISLEELRHAVPNELDGIEELLTEWLEGAALEVPAEDRPDNDGYQQAKQDVRESWQESEDLEVPLPLGNAVSRAIEEVRRERKQQRGRRQRGRRGRITNLRGE